MSRSIMLLLPLLVLGGCGGLAGKAEQKLSAPRPCQVLFVPEAPRGAARLGIVLVPAEDAAAQRLDEQSRTYACGLNATHAVKEEERVEKGGRRIWRMRLFRR
jgi:hypothetical protein